MRALYLAALTLCLAPAVPASAQDSDRYPVSMMSVDDVVRAVRCAPPKICKPAREQRLPKPPKSGGRDFASYYAHAHHGRRTASGERFNMHAMTAAHKTLPFGTRLRVSRGAHSVVVRINDRGPFIAGRTIDLSLAAARALHLPGVGAVTLERIN